VLTHAFQIGVLLGGEENSTKKQMQAVIDFETELAKITTPPDERRDEEKLYNLMSLSELQRKAPLVRSRTFVAEKSSILVERLLLRSL
jgi:endothelin-converting enzyme